MIVMNKYCERKWDRSRPAYTIRSRKYRKLEKLQISDSTVDNVIKEKK